MSFSFSYSFHFSYERCQHLFRIIHIQMIWKKEITVGSGRLAPLKKKKNYKTLKLEFLQSGEEQTHKCTYPLICTLQIGEITSICAEPANFHCRSQPQKATLLYHTNAIILTSRICKSSGQKFQLFTKPKGEELILCFYDAKK